MIASKKTQTLGTAPALGARHPSCSREDLLAKIKLQGTDPALGARHPSCSREDLLAKIKLPGTDPALGARHPSCSREDLLAKIKLPGTDPAQGAMLAFGKEANSEFLNSAIFFRSMVALSYLVNERWGVVGGTTEGSNLSHRL